MSSGNVLRNTRFARVFFAGAASVSGFSIGQVAINYYVYKSTNSSVELAFVGVAFTIALVSLSLFGGTLADRQDRRAIMIVSDAVRAASLALVAITLYLLGFNYLLVLAASFILGSFSAIFQPAERALIPSILRQDQLAEANGLIQLTSSLAQAFANAAGGALVVIVGAVLAIGLNSVTFLVSGLLIASMTTRKLSQRAAEVSSPQPAPKRAGFIEDTREGVRYLVGNFGLLMLTVAAGVFNLFFAMIMPFAVIYTTEILHGGATTYGVFLALFSLGWAPGSLIVGRVGAVKRAGLAWCLSGIVEGVVLFLLVLFPIAAVAFSSIFLAGFFLGFGVTTWLSIVQIIVPNDMQGRYFGIDQLGSFAVLPVGQVIGGLAIAAFGISWTYAVGAGGVLLSSLACLAFSDLRKLGYTRTKEQHATT